MEMVNVKVNGIAVSVPAGSTILEAARYAGVEIPRCASSKISMRSALAASASWKRPGLAAS